MIHAIVYDAAPIPNRLNEDAYYFDEDERRVVMMVADGATPRLRLDATQPLYDTLRAGATSAYFAAQIVRQTVAADPDASPRDLLLRANANLRGQLEAVYGNLTPSAVLAKEPQLRDVLDADPRLLRLALPVAVATIACIDLEADQLHVAHAGDCALLLVNQDDSVELVTDDQMGQHDHAALTLAQELKKARNIPHLSDVIAGEQVRKMNVRNGLYHNFEDEAGNPDLQRGVGVINGLDLLDAYLQVDTIDLDSRQAILLATDGALFPISWGESPATRYAEMWRFIKQRGLSAYLRYLRAMERDDAYFDQYPRFKLHDDATMMVLALE